MCPTSIAVWKPKRAAADRAGVALHRLPDVGEARREVATVLDAAQMPARAVRAGDELPLPQRLVGHDLAGEADRARASPGSAPNAARISSSVAGRNVAAERRSELRLLEPVVAADEPEDDRPVVLRTTGIAFDVAAGSIPRNAGELVDRRDPGRRDLLRAVERARETSARAGTPRAISRSAA